jgi:hypothetical protein
MTGMGSHGVTRVRLKQAGDPDIVNEAVSGKLLAGQGFLLAVWAAMFCSLLDEL